MTDTTKPTPPDEAVEAAPFDDKAAEASAPSGIFAFISRMVSHPKAPYAAGAILLLAAAAVFSPVRLSTLVGRPAIVVFDPVRFMNSQRAAASILAAAPRENGDTALMLSQVGKRAEAVILEEARGAVVLVKQAVVAPDGLVDITDAVLDRFGLPKDVPTVNASGDALTLENLAPTDHALGGGALREDYRMELENRATKAAIEAAKRDSQNAVVP